MILIIYKYVMDLEEVKTEENKIEDNYMEKLKKLFCPRTQTEQN